MLLQCKEQNITVIDSILHDQLRGVVAERAPYPPSELPRVKSLPPPPIIHLECLYKRAFRSLYLHTTLITLLRMLPQQHMLTSFCLLKLHLSFLFSISVYRLLSFYFTRQRLQINQ